MRALQIGITAILAIAVALYVVATRSEMGQDALLSRVTTAVAAQQPMSPPEGGMRVFMCGTSSPLPVPDRAQACVAVLVDERLFIVDAGARSANVASLGGLPMNRLQAILITHYHSDHIASIPDFNLMSWVAGRPQPLQIVGPGGAQRVVDGMNAAYMLDRSYRVAHHGAELLPPELGVLEARTIEPGVVLDEDGLRITAFTVDHTPVAPAVGYRFDYAGRSVVVAGDTIVAPGLEEAARDADLLLSDALAMPIVQALERAAAAAGRTRNEKILRDIQDYHVHTDAIAEMAERVGVRQLALYHLVPAPRNSIMERVFRRGLPGDVILTDDAMIFDFPPDSDEIVVDP